MEEFRTRSLTDAGPFTFAAADALAVKVREGHRGHAACEEPNRAGYPYAPYALRTAR